MSKPTGNGSGKELFVFTLCTGIMITIILTAANVYLGLYAGMTVSASIPAAIAAMGIFRLTKRKSIHQSNIVQTMASAGESLAAGTLFTIPALVLVGAWQEFKFWPTTLIGLCGGILGVIFMIPLRKSLIVNNRELVYPEGVACSTVLHAGQETSFEGLKRILLGVGIGSLVKLFNSGFGILTETVEGAVNLSNRIFYLGSDISPALLGVGYIVNLNIAFLVFLGGVMAWLIGIPLLDISTGADSTSLESAWQLWSEKIRYVGVGAMLVGGAWSLITVRKGISDSISRLSKIFKGNKNGIDIESTEDIQTKTLLYILVICCAALVGLYTLIIGKVSIAFLACSCMIPAAFLFSAVSSYITGVVGSSNNPVSGMTISALLVTAFFILIAGFRADSAIVATLGVAAVVCCAACTAGDCSQDLKTGQIVGTLPKYQQIAQILGVVAGSVVIAPVLVLLHTTYGIGTGLKAPQATLFANLAQGIFGSGKIPAKMIFIGIIAGIVIILSDTFIAKGHKRFRLHLMPIAVGIYLPFSLAVPIFIGGLIRYFNNRQEKIPDKDQNSDTGFLMSSGLIAGEALMGVLVAAIVYVGANIKIGAVDSWIQNSLSVLLFVVTCILLKQSLKN